MKTPPPNKRQVSAQHKLPASTLWTRSPPGKLMVAAGFGSLASLSEATGYTVNHLRYLFIGRRMPTTEALLRLKDATKVDGDRLLEAFRPYVVERLRDFQAAQVA